MDLVDRLVEAIANKIEIAGKVIIVGISIPAITAVLEIITEVI